MHRTMQKTCHRAGATIVMVILDAGRRLRMLEKRYRRAIRQYLRGQMRVRSQSFVPINCHCLRMLLCFGAYLWRSSGGTKSVHSELCSESVRVTDTAFLCNDRSIWAKPINRHKLTYQTLAIQRAWLRAFKRNLLSQLGSSNNSLLGMQC